MKNQIVLKMFQDHNDDNVALTLRVFNIGKGSYKGDFPEVINHLKEQWV